MRKSVQNIDKMCRFLCHTVQVEYLHRYGNRTGNYFSQNFLTVPYRWNVRPGTVTVPYRRK